MKDTGELSETHCVSVVAQYLLGQDWQLVSPLELGAQVWARLKERGTAAATTPQTIHQEAWQLYGAILHHNCHQNQGRAWTELTAWLQCQVSRVTNFPPEQEEAVQEAVIALQQQLQEAPLKAPRALFAYALQVLRREAIDLHRRRTAVMRGEGAEFSLEEISEEGDNWEEQITDVTNEGQSVEMHVADKEIRQQLENFFRRHLASELQVEVAEAHFLDGLSPVEIADLMGKRPHEIRLLKARIVQKLQTLNEEDRQQLLAILGRVEEESPHE